MGFLSDAVKSVVKVVTAPAKAIWKGVRKLQRAAWRGIKKVMASKVFKIGMLILSVVGMGMALMAGVAAFSAAGGFANIVNAALQGGGAVLNSLTGGMAGKFGSAVKGIFGGAQTIPQALAKFPAGGLGAAADTAGAAGDILMSGAPNVAQVGKTVSLGQKIMEAPSKLIEAFQGYGQTALDFVTSPLDSIQEAWQAVKANVMGTADPIATVQPTIPGAPTGAPPIMPTPGDITGQYTAFDRTGVAAATAPGGLGGPGTAFERAATSAAAATTAPAEAAAGGGLWEATKAVLPAASVALGQGLSGYAQGKAQQEMLKQKRKEQEARDREFTSSVSSGLFEEQVGGFGIDLSSKWTDPRRFPSEEARFRDRFRGRAA